MPRPPRLHVPGGCYHVMLRGNHREALFGSDDDRRVLNEIFASVLIRFDARLHAFCWMSNHLHALLQIADRPLGDMMKRVAMRYSRHRHKLLRTTGHLFERRYKARLVEVDEYFLTLLRYIHLNPVKAGITSDPADYPWSSHRAYLGTESMPWLCTSFGLSLFAPDLHRARSAYQQFVLTPGAANEELDEGSHPDDPRVLGSDEFISKIPITRYRPRSPLTLEQLAGSICQSHRISIEQLRSRSRARSLTPVRVEFALQAVELRVATLADVARFLYRDPSALTRLLAHRGRLDRS